MFQNFSKLSLSVSKNTNQTQDLTCISVPTFLSESSSTAVTSNTDATLVEDLHRGDLEIYNSRNEIIQNIIESPIVIITGQTGCGKVS